MTDPPPSSFHIPSELADPALRRRLVALAYRFVGPTNAEDLLSEAITRVCDPARSRWDPADGTLFAHMARLMRDLAIKQRRSARARHEVIDSEAAHVDAVVDVAAPADDLSADKDDLAHFRRCGAALRAALVAKDDAEAIQVFDLKCKGLEGRAELARELGWTDQAVKRTNKRIEALALLVKAADDRAEAERLRARRQGTLPVRERT